MPRLPGARDSVQPRAFTGGDGDSARPGVPDVDYGRSLGVLGTDRNTPEPRGESRREAGRWPSREPAGEESGPSAATRYEQATVEVGASRAGQSRRCSVRSPIFI